jgi:multidrug efflux pump subunit AcrA (membrane-fusion protein)
MKKEKIVTVIIILFIALFALLIAYTVIRKKPDTPAANSTAQSPPGAGQAGGQARQSPDGQAGRQGPGEQGGGQARQSAGEQAGGQARQGPGGQAGGQSRQGPGEQSGGQARQGPARNATVVQVMTVEKGTIENSVVINGDVLARNQVAIFPTVGGKLVESRIGIGDRVGIGNVVAMVDPSRPGEVYSLSPVVSTISGTVLQAPYSIGDTVSAQSSLFVVGDLSVLRVETFVPERFVSSIRLGLGAVVKLEALPGETFSAEIDEVSPVLDPASRTLRIKLRFVAPQPSPQGEGSPLDSAGRGGTDPRIKAGMFATISLVTRTRANVPIIPRTSAINTYGSWIVFIIDENNIARRRTVELGIENERFFEVLSGINPGDRVVTAGQNFLTDGDPVRIVE